MEEQPITPAAPESVRVVDIQFRPGQKIYYFDPAGLTLRQGCGVIIETARGEEYGVCTSGVHTVPVAHIVSPLRSVVRIATEADMRVVREHREKEKIAQETCREKIEQLGLDMQLVGVEYAFDGTKLLFFFTADERVDFRELVRQLAAVFHTRIELRQIGVRDKTKMIGGLGVCGRPFCCSTFLSDFQPVTVKMAKTQGLSLNPTKISGTCGRLLCCLKYEQEAYEDLLSTTPKEASFVDTPDGRGTIMSVNLLRQRVNVRMENAPDTINTYPIADIAVLRNGRAHRSDPPIPDDLAPISGVGAPARREKAEDEEQTFLEPIRFRYRDDDVVDEQDVPAAPSIEPDAAPDEQKSAAKRHRAGRRERIRRETAQKSPRTKDDGKLADVNRSAAENPRSKDDGKPADTDRGAAEKPRSKDDGKPADTDRGAAEKPRTSRPYYRRRKAKPTDSPEQK